MTSIRFRVLPANGTKGKKRDVQADHHRTAALFGLASTAQVAPNFIAFNQNGLKVTPNQQFASNFDSMRVLITNAIGISFTNICSMAAAFPAASPLASRCLS